jgi:hypothetical protein
MSKHLNRRAVLAGAAAVPSRRLPHSPAMVMSSCDVSGPNIFVMRLQMQRHVREQDRPGPAFDAEFPPCPDDVLPGHHWRAHKWLWRKHGLDRLNDDWNAADSAMRETIAAILRSPAEGLFGIGVKLAALPNDYDAEDCVDAAAAVRRDIDRLIGSNFAALITNSAEEDVS